MSAINQVASDTTSEVFPMRTIFSAACQDSTSIARLPETSPDLLSTSSEQSSKSPSIVNVINGNADDICAYNEHLSDSKVTLTQSTLVPGPTRVIIKELSSPQLVQNVQCEGRNKDIKINQISSDSSSQKPTISNEDSAKRQLRAKIYAIEELFDSTSDLDLPGSPPPPVPTVDVTLRATSTRPPLLRSFSATQSEISPALPPETRNSLKSVLKTSSPVPEFARAPALEVIQPATDEMSANCVPAPAETVRNSVSNSGTPPPSAIISENHYERLIEELKCPGCASPMKAPIRLCGTGHSVCEKCTVTLMLCPLCTSAFTDMRSRTVEALCSKALFRCQNAASGCTCRLQLDLLNWHQKQCIYKSMRCFMGRVWGECSWTGIEANWKEHLETEHTNRVFTTKQVELAWDLNERNKPLAGYYVFLVFDEMFNFYQVYDRDRILFTMTVTSSIRERKLNFAYEVEMFHTENEALCITQRFPVHSEYDKDILLDGTCVAVSLTDLARLLGQQKVLHFRVRIHEVKSPKKTKPPVKPSRKHPIDFQQTQIEGANLKSVPAEVIHTRKPEDSSADSNGQNDGQSEIENSEASSSFGFPENEALVEKSWGTPQLNFNRKFLRTNGSKDSCSTSSGSSGSASERTHNGIQRASCESNSKMKSMTSSLRKSFRSLKTDIIEMKKPFSKKSPEKKESLIKK